MENENLLTESEKIARKHMLHVLLEASNKPCDISGDELELTLPVWYDVEKFKRGQKYFADNRFGILGSSFYGLVTLLCDARGLKILMSTGRSSTAETARKRYISTIMHLMSWYQDDLKPGSSSWESLTKVRKMHLHASQASEKKMIGFISQTELSLTTFGFMGYAILKPHQLAIRCDKTEDLDGFIHLWAVIGAMLGVEDQFNICLYQLDVVKEICKIFLRYLFNPRLSVETEYFVQMVTAITDAFSPIMNGCSYESMIFQVRRISGIPGYQYDLDVEKEIYFKPIFSNDDFEKIRSRIETTDEKSLFDLLLLSEVDFNGNHEELLEKFKEIYNVDKISIDIETIKKSFNENLYKCSLNDEKFSKLKNSDKRIIKRNCFLFKICNYWIGRVICEGLISITMLVAKFKYKS